ncbi:transmembrane protein 135-like isoform X2 [Lycorma delicatula]|uniref:transmembrane protein 135-like isoform X2 n=1 Tax=Lycorma delicatula TaxID=130591 RepID=UPI003F518A1B
MVSVSKHVFNSNVAHLSCSQVSHPWAKSCFKGYFQMLISTLIGSGKFYLLFYIVHLIKSNSFSLENLKETIFHFIHDLCVWGLIGSGYLGSSCIFRKILQRHGYYTLSFLSGSIGGMAIFASDPKRRGFVVTTIKYLVFEILYRILQEKGIFKRTMFFDTLFFMISSASLLYLLRSKKKSSTFLWFFTPSEVKNSNQLKSSPCSHADPCWKFVLFGSIKYFILGFLLQFARSVVKRNSTINLLKTVCSLDTYLFGMFAGSYSLLYKSIVCILCQWFKYDSAVYSIPAGFIAGVAYAIQPNLTISVIAFTNIIKIILENISEKVSSSNIPWQEVFFVINTGIIIYFRIMHAHIMTDNTKNIMNSLTNGRAEEMYSSFINCVNQKADY